MRRDHPKVSIGLPVYNGEVYIEETLDSLLAQTYEDFELIIADNASTDSTEAICRAYAGRDTRIRYVRNRTNIGAAPNYTLVARLACGELFKWAAHDDVCDRDFLMRCVAALDAHPEALLAYPRTLVIDGGGAVIGEGGARPATCSPRPHQRLREMAQLGTDVYPIFGVIRADALRSVLPHRGYAGADRVLLVQLCLRGPFIEVPEALFRIRHHAGQYSERFSTSHSSVSWWDASETKAVTWANWRRLSGLEEAVDDAPLSREERIRCYIVLLQWMRAHWKRLCLDAVVVGRHRLQRYRSSLPAT